MFVDILSFCSLSVLFCLFLHPPSFIFYVFLFLSFVLSLITCTIFIGDTITTIPCLFNYECIMFKSTLIVVWQPSGYMVRAFHWQYGDIILAIYFLSLLITLYCLWKINILYYTILYYAAPMLRRCCADAARNLRRSCADAVPMLCWCLADAAPVAPGTLLFSGVTTTRQSRCGFSTRWIFAWVDRSSQPSSSGATDATSGRANTSPAVYFRKLFALKVQWAHCVTKGHLYRTNGEVAVMSVLRRNLGASVDDVMTSATMPRLS